MKTLALAFLTPALAIPVQGLDEGVDVAFPGFTMKQRVVFPAKNRPDGVVWESGASEPVGADFGALFFEGVASRPSITFEASVKDGPDWGAWVAAQGERFANGRFWAKTVVSGKQGALVRLRAVHNGGGAHGSLEFFGLSAASLQEERPSQTAQAAAQPEPSAPLAAPQAEIQPRWAWGALAAGTPYEPMIPERITVHHTAAAQPLSREAAVAELQALQRAHQGGRGWIDIGYHFLIDGTGQIWEGRPVTVVGAHVLDNNEGTIGISIMGDFHPPKNQRPTPAQLDSLVRLARQLSRAYRIPADRIKGHRDQETTACPGDFLYARLDEVRQAVAAPEPPAVAAVVQADRFWAKVMAQPDLKDMLNTGGTP